MTERRDVPIFRVICFLLCMLSIGCLLMRIGSLSDVIGLVRNPELTTQWSVMVFLDIVDGLAFCGPFFIGYFFCGFLGFHWRFDMKKANLCLILGIIVAAGQIITMIAISLYGYQLITQSAFQDSITPTAFVIRSSLAFLPGLFMMAIYFVGVKKMKMLQHDVK